MYKSIAKKSGYRWKAAIYSVRLEYNVLYLLTVFTN